MHYAILGGSRTIINSLALAKPELLKMADSQGFTALHAAVEVSNAATNNSLRELTEPLYQLDWNAKTSLGVTPLILAAQKSNWLAIELLCSMEATQVDLQDSANNTALFYAVTRACLPAVQILLQKRGSNPNMGGGITSPMWRAVLVLYKDAQAVNPSHHQHDTHPHQSVSDPSSSSTQAPNMNFEPASPTMNSNPLSFNEVPNNFFSASSTSPSPPIPSPSESSPLSSSSSSPTSAHPLNRQPQQQQQQILQQQQQQQQPQQDYIGSISLVSKDSPIKTGIRHGIASSLFHYGGDLESPNLAGSHLIHEIANRALKDPFGITGPAEFEFVFENAPHAIHQFNRNKESFLHLLAKLHPVSSPEPLVATVRKLWKRYRWVVGSNRLNAAFYEKETLPSPDGSPSLIHTLVQYSNDALLADLATGSDPILQKLKFPFEATKTMRRHPIMCALAVGNLSVCSLLFDHFTFSLSRSEWKQLFALATKVGCLEKAKAAQLRCQPHKA